jgi:hypothetical protein
MILAEHMPLEQERLALVKQFLWELVSLQGLMASNSLQSNENKETLPIKEAIQMFPVVKDWPIATSMIVKMATSPKPAHTQYTLGTDQRTYSYQYTSTFS